MNRMPTENELSQALNRLSSPLGLEAITLHLNSGDLKLDCGVVMAFKDAILKMIGEDKLQILHKAILDGFAKEKAKHMPKTYRPKKARK